MSYLSETATAVKQLFKALTYYQKLLKDINIHKFVALENSIYEINRVITDWREEYKTEIKLSLERQEAYIAQQFSRDTISGAIIQIATMGIKLEGHPCQPPEIFRSMISDEGEILNFCCGRSVRGVPVGLIIYATRNQYNHQDANSLNKLNTTIFDTLAYNHGIKGMENVKEPAFDVNNPCLKIYSCNVLHLLGWSTYEDYRNDMEAFLSPKR